MRKIVWLILAATICLPLQSQNLLSPSWVFSTGDDLEWANPTFDDTGWRTIKPGILWEQQGLTTYDGYAWYRNKTVISSKIKKESKQAGGLILELGKIDDADYTYFNGVLVGQTGEFPPDYQGAHDKQRVYDIPFDLIQWNKENTIAVRVYDHGGGGGIYDGPIHLRVKGQEDFLEIKAHGLPDDRVFVDTRVIDLPVEVKNTQDKAIKGSISITVLNDFRNEIMSQSFNINMKKQASTMIPFSINDLPPGFYKAEIQVSGDMINKKVPVHFAVDPTKVVSPVDSKDDFEEFWNRARAELASVDPGFKITRVDSFSTTKRDVYLVEMRSLGNVLVRGWYAKPTREGVYPAILHVQGYSSNLQPQAMYPGDDFAVFALNIRGHGNSRDEINPGFPGYLLHGIESPETYIYRGAYMDCIRAVDFLFSRPEVDQSRVVVEGGSQGGALSIATAALDNQRIALCVPGVPFLSDFRNYFKVAAWPGNEFTDYVQTTPGPAWEKVYTTLSYIDIKNLAPWVKAPVLMGVGLLDVVCPPRINFAAYNNLGVSRQFVIYPEAGHGLPSTHNEYKYKWIKENLGL